MTLRAELRSQYDVQDAAPAVDWAGLRELPRPLPHYKLFAGHFRYFLRRLLPPEVKAFTFLRDPVERSISHLKHMATDPSFHELHRLAAGRSLIEIARDPRIAAPCSDVMTGYLSPPRKGMDDRALRNLPAEDACVMRPTGIDEAMAALQAMDFIGFVDDLEADFARLCEMLELHPPEALPIINAEAERPRRLAADAEVRRVVVENNPLDCALWQAAQQFRARRPPLADRRERLLRAARVRRLSADRRFARPGRLRPAAGPRLLAAGGRLAAWVSLDRPADRVLSGAAAATRDAVHARAGLRLPLRHRRAGRVGRRQGGAAAARGARRRGGSSGARHRRAESACRSRRCG